jgi:ubiquinone/menaquinone biosynthesis C-methylase UbiE
LYSRYVFPWILERIEGPEIHELRRRCVSEAGGDVLEIGLGTGKTLPHYGRAVRSLTAVEPNVGMRRALESRIAAAGVPVQLVQAAGERLPFDDERFDCVVLSLVLCTVDDPQATLGEIRRVLKPGGRCTFFEHVASEDAKSRRWQNRLNWIQRIVGCGCNLNRDSERAMRDAGFRIESAERRISRDMPINPRLFPFVLGVAVKPLETPRPAVVTATSGPPKTRTPG